MKSLKMNKQDFIFINTILLCLNKILKGGETMDKKKFICKKHNIKFNEGEYCLQCWYEAREKVYNKFTSDNKKIRINIMAEYKKLAKKYHNEIEKIEK